MRLRCWQAPVARANVDPTDYYKELREHGFLVDGTLDVPLNLQGNAHNLFYPTLKTPRAEAEAVARPLPVL
jgi:hypothetical protein